MAPYFVNPAWFQEHWYGNRPVSRSPSSAPAWVALFASAVLAGVVLLGGLGPIGT